MKQCRITTTIQDGQFSECRKLWMVIGCSILNHITHVNHHNISTLKERYITFKRIDISERLNSLFNIVVCRGLIDTGHWEGAHAQDSKKILQNTQQPFCHTHR